MLASEADGQNRLTAHATVKLTTEAQCLAKPQSPDT